jgi:hypothetical protein
MSASNVHFNGPEKQTFSPVTGNNAAWIPQGDFEAPREKHIVMSGLMQNENPFDASRYTCGEIITSLKQLLTKMCGNRTPLTPNSNQSCAVLPFTLGGIREVSTTYTYGPFACDYVSTFSSLYVLARGSVNIMFVDRSSADGALGTYTNAATVSTVPISFASNISQPVTTNIPVTKATNGHTNIITVPQWGLTHSRQSDTWFSNVAKQPSLGEPQTVVTYNTPTQWSSGSLSVLRSAGDDYQLGFFIGVPVMYFDSGTNAFI